MMIISSETSHFLSSCLSQKQKVKCPEVTKTWDKGQCPGQASDRRGNGFEGRVGLKMGSEKRAVLHLDKSKINVSSKANAEIRSGRKQQNIVKIKFFKTLEASPQLCNNLKRLIRGE